MSSLYYFNPLSITQEVFRKDVLAWSKLYNLITGAVGMNDRTNILEQPIKLSSYSRCRLPVISSTNITYNECLDERAHELFQLSNFIVFNILLFKLKNKRLIILFFRLVDEI